MIQFAGTKRPILFALFTVGATCLFAFVGWILSRHGTVGLLRLTPIFLYVLILIIILGTVLIGLFLAFLQLSRKGKGSIESRLSVFLFALSIICIALFPSAFVQLEGLPRSKDIKRVAQLNISPNYGLSLHFAVGSDAHFGAGTNSPTVTYAILSQVGNVANKYNLFFSLGDLVQHGFKDDQWSEAFQMFFPTASIVPTRFAPGNHDTLFGGLSRYEDYCGPPGTTSPDSRLWYRIDAGRAHFLVLDVEWSAESVTQEQLDWVQIQLGDMPDEDWKIVMSHGFYYSSGRTSMGWKSYDNPETISTLATLFEKYGVDMVFSGHNHYLEFLQHSGINYVICGGLGGRLDSVPTYISPSSVWRQPGQFGFADVNISSNLAILNFRAPDSSVLKGFTLRKR